MKYYYLPASLFACLLAGQAVAGGAAPFYLGGTIGRTSVDTNSNQMDNHGVCTKAGTINQTCTIEDSGTSAHIYGGMQITDSIAIEGGYVSLGDSASYHYSDPIEVRQQTTGITLSGVARHRISQTSPIAVYGKAGVVRWSSEAEVTSNNPAVNSQTIKQSGYSPVIGAGVQYEMNENMTLRAGWDRYYNVGEKETLLHFNETGTAADLNTLDTDVDVISAGINYNFL